MHSHDTAHTFPLQLRGPATADCRALPSHQLRALQVCGWARERQAAGGGCIAASRLRPELCSPSRVPGNCVAPSRATPCPFKFAAATCRPASVSMLHTGRAAPCPSARCGIPSASFTFGTRTGPVSAQACPALSWVIENCTRRNPATPADGPSVPPACFREVQRHRRLAHWLLRPQRVLLPGRRPRQPRPRLEVLVRLGQP